MQEKTRENKLYFPHLQVTFFVSRVNFVSLFFYALTGLFPIVPVFHFLWLDILNRTRWNINIYFSNIIVGDIENLRNLKFHQHQYCKSGFVRSMKVINLNFWHNFPDHVISTPPTARKTFTQYHSSPLRQNFHQQPFPVREVQLDYHSISTLLFLPCDAKISSSSFIPTSMNYFSGTGLTADRSSFVFEKL